MATLGKATEKKKKANRKKTSVNMSFGGSPEYTLCTLMSKKQETNVIDLTVLAGEEIILVNKGWSPVHLIGNYISQPGLTGDAEEEHNTEKTVDALSMDRHKEKADLEEATQDNMTDDTDFDSEPDISEFDESVTDTEDEVENAQIRSMYNSMIPFFQDDDVQINRYAKEKGVALSASDRIKRDSKATKTVESPDIVSSNSDGYILDDSVVLAIKTASVEMSNKDGGQHMTGDKHLLSANDIINSNPKVTKKAMEALDHKDITDNSSNKESTASSGDDHIDHPSDINRDSMFENEKAKSEINKDKMQDDPIPTNTKQNIVGSTNNDNDTIMLDSKKREMPHLKQDMMEANEMATTANDNVSSQVTSKKHKKKAGSDNSKEKNLNVTTKSKKAISKSGNQSAKQQKRKKEKLKKQLQKAIEQGIPIRVPSIGEPESEPFSVKKMEGKHNKKSQQKQKNSKAGSSSSMPEANMNKSPPPKEDKEVGTKNTLKTEHNNETVTCNSKMSDSASNESNKSRTKNKAAGQKSKKAANKMNSDDGKGLQVAKESLLQDPQTKTEVVTSNGVPQDSKATTPRSTSDGNNDIPTITNAVKDKNTKKVTKPMAARPSRTAANRAVQKIQKSYGNKWWQQEENQQ
ncbi:hypothetical protein BDF20DRAFT_840030 [Mycotypha africana]|uniref:uncharacterized protein n=1 Tax=Mycotypha africana TaxID=64632 RepID=UPI00230075BA|nr:uncharacterized protein BDF20DRAFT_840030 [Mycotypha africana]KAI8967822.1 hypothetical protein BDF20DRAFT_840030 [Mycotypha africana]